MSANVQQLSRKVKPRHLLLVALAVAGFLVFRRATGGQQPPADEGGFGAAAAGDFSGVAGPAGGSTDTGAAFGAASSDLATLLDALQAQQAELSSRVSDFAGHVTELEDAFSAGGFTLNEDKTWSPPAGEAPPGEEGAIDVGYEQWPWRSPDVDPFAEARGPGFGSAPASRALKKAARGGLRVGGPKPEPKAPPKGGKAPATRPSRPKGGKAPKKKPKKKRGAGASREYSGLGAYPNRVLASSASYVQPPPRPGLPTISSILIRTPTPLPRIGLAAGTAPTAGSRAGAPASSWRQPPGHPGPAVAVSPQQVAQSPAMPGSGLRSVLPPGSLPRVLPLAGSPATVPVPKLAALRPSGVRAV